MPNPKFKMGKSYIILVLLSIALKMRFAINCYKIMLYQ